VDTTLQGRKQSRIPLAPGSPTARSRSCWICQARGVGLHQNYRAGGQARRHHGLALHTRASAQARQAATEVPAHAARPRRPRPFAARSRATQCSKTAWARYSISRGVCAIKSRVSVGRRSIRCTPPGGSAAARLGFPSLAATPVTAPKGGQFLLHAKALDDKSLRRLCNRSRHRQPRKACTGYRPRHPQRQGLSRSQLSRPVQGLYQRPGPAYHQRRSPRDATPSCRGTRDRPSPRKITVWFGTIARAATATASTRFAPPLATTSAHSCANSGAYYTACS
jgi:hypothetical protein